MKAAAGYCYMLPELTTEEYLLIMFALNRCRDGVSYGFRIRQLIGKIKAGSEAAASGPDGKEEGYERQG